MPCLPQQFTQRKCHIKTWGDFSTCGKVLSGEYTTTFKTVYGTHLIVTYLQMRGISCSLHIGYLLPLEQHSTLRISRALSRFCSLFVLPRISHLLDPHESSWQGKGGLNQAVRSPLQCGRGAPNKTKQLEWFKVQKKRLSIFEELVETSRDSKTIRHYLDSLRRPTVYWSFNAQGLCSDHLWFHIQGQLRWKQFSKPFFLFRSDNHWSIHICNPTFIRETCCKFIAVTICTQVQKKKNVFCLIITQCHLSSWLCNLCHDDWQGCQTPKGVWVAFCGLGLWTGVFCSAWGSDVSQSFIWRTLCLRC